MGLTTIILLTGEAEWPFLSIWLRQQNPDVQTYVVESRSELDAIPFDLLADARLCAFCTNVLVPAALLARLGYGAYNIHPGSPAYPGWSPASFAFYDGAVEFGATAHVMTAKVDAGPIVDVELFQVAPDMAVQHVRVEAYQAATRLFRRLADRLTCEDRLLPALPVAWGSRKYSRRCFARMCELTRDMSRMEIERRIAAFGDGDGISTPAFLPERKTVPMAGFESATP